jgi:pantetheine-phosphate adenylyltransferase
MRVCIGGTFNLLHKGHKLLIDKAFQIAGEKGYVFIGITIGKIIKGKRGVKSFEERKKAIIRYLSEKGLNKHVIIKPINDKYGPSIDGDYDAIIVSPETFKTAEEINKKRIENGRKTLSIVRIPFVLAEDGLPINSSRIKNNEIDEEGKIRKRD